MVGPTLVDIRSHIEELATDAGRYYLVCARTGDRPVPTVGCRFPDRPTARAAARATEQYRAALRRYDPRTPHCDLIVCEVGGPAHGPTAAPRDARRKDDTGTRTRVGGDRDRIEFCHRVAGATFEALSAGGYDAVETAVMDAYFELAERVDDQDELCSCLLESTAAELDERLAPSAQADLLAEAARRLGPVETSDPLAAALSAIEGRGLADRAARSPWSVDLDSGTRSVVVRLAGYTLAPRDGRLPVLPLTLELTRHMDDRRLGSVAVVPFEGGWRLTLQLTDGSGRNGLVRAPITEATTDG